MYIQHFIALFYILFDLILLPLELLGLPVLLSVSSERQKTKAHFKFNFKSDVIKCRRWIYLHCL